MTVTGWSGVEGSDGRHAEVLGRYRRLDVRQAADEEEPEYLGHAAVELEDGTLVLLEPAWAEAAIRPAEEIARFDGQLVRASGTLHASAPEPDEEVAAIVSPCLTPVEAVEAAD